MLRAGPLLREPMPKKPAALIPPKGTIAFIGGGNMARSLIGALIRGGIAAGSIAAAEPDTTTREALARDFGIAAHANNTDAVADAPTSAIFQQAENRLHAPKAVLHLLAGKSA